MNALIVVDDPAEWPTGVQVPILSAHAYLSEPAYGADRPAKVFNLCDSSRYQGLGYYVSLLAEARGHAPLPLAATLEDVQSRKLVDALTGELVELAAQALAGVDSATYEIRVHFGQDPTHRHPALARELFKALQAPLVAAEFVRDDGPWQLRSLRLLSAADLSDEEREFALQAAALHLCGPRWRRNGARPHLAILHNPDNPEVASNPQAMEKFAHAALSLGIEPEFITPTDFDRVPEFDALFIRDTTFMHHYTYRFARRAAAEGLVVIDDPESILRCNNKVYLAELLARHKLPAPKTLLVHRGNRDLIVPTLSLPCVLKQPDGSFSNGVVKVESEAELQAEVERLLDQSALIVAQEWLPTEFDWRVGILDRRPIFVCKYYMAPGHWQIIKHEGASRCEGRTLALALGEAPEPVLETALQAANLIGDGFYGVDIKEVDKRCCIVEINDNPNVDAGNEDGVLQDALYREVMGVFRRRIEERKHGRA